MENSVEMGYQLRSVHLYSPVEKEDDAITQKVENFGLNYKPNPESQIVFVLGI